MTIHKTVSRNIRILRAERKISQDELAHRASLQRSHMSNLENAKVDIKISTIEKIANALDVDAAYLLTDHSKKR